MTQYLIKVVLSAFVIATVAEVSKRSTLIGGIVVSLPLTSILSLIWLYMDTKDVTKVAQLSNSILWLVLPSLILFLVLPLMLKTKAGFTISLLTACTATALGYAGLVVMLKKFGVEL